MIAFKQFEDALCERGVLDNTTLETHVYGELPQQELGWMTRNLVDALYASDVDPVYERRVSVNFSGERGFSASLYQFVFLFNGSEPATKNRRALQYLAVRAEDEKTVLEYLILDNRAYLQEAGPSTATVTDILTSKGADLVSKVAKLVADYTGAENLISDVGHVAIRTETAIEEVADRYVELIQVNRS